MKLTSDQVKKVAKLANLNIGEKEIKNSAGQLSKILDYVDQLEKVDTSSIEPTFNVTGQANVFAEDIVSESLSQKEALLNAESTKNGFFITKGVFEEE